MQKKPELTRAEQGFKMRVQALWDENWKLFEEVLAENDWISIDDAHEYVEENREPEHNEGYD